MTSQHISQKQWTQQVPQSDLPFWVMDLYGEFFVPVVQVFQVLPRKHLTQIRTGQLHHNAILPGSLS